MSSRSDLVLVTPAMVVDLADVVGVCSIGQWVAAERQLALGTSYAIRDAAGALVVGGYVASGPMVETWFWPAPRASRRMIAVLRLVRLTLSAHRHDRLYAVIRSPNGRRIARALGYRPIGQVRDNEVWTHG